MRWARWQLGPSAFAPWLALLSCCSAFKHKIGRIVTPNDPFQGSNIPNTIQNTLTSPGMVLPSYSTSAYMPAPTTDMVPVYPSTLSTVFTVTNEIPKIVVPTNTPSLVNTPVPPLPTSPPIQGSKAEQMCQQYTHSNRRRQVTPYVIGGVQTLLAEFPHMAALGYGDLTNLQWLCGGSLISEQFVLTAAHCVNSQQLGEVRYVRLGDTNLQSSRDDDHVQQFLVVEQRVHPAYRPPSLYNDLALLRLDHPVTVSEYVRPVCLNGGAVVAAGEVLAAGWGKTSYGGTTSDTLMKVTLEVFGQAQCQATYQTVSPDRLAHGVDAPSQVCAGSRRESKDTCEGDSGGPLMIRNSYGMLYLIGITSFGMACGIPDKPAVYTRVNYFLPWIESIVWPN